MRLHRGHEDRAYIPSRVSAQRAHGPFVQSREHDDVERPDRLPCLGSSDSAIRALLGGKDANIPADRGLPRQARQRWLSRSAPIADRRSRGHGGLAAAASPKLVRELAKRPPPTVQRSGTRVATRDLPSSRGGQDERDR